MANFLRFIVNLAEAEGGFADDPRDPGGATNKGITLATFRAYFGKDKTVKDLKNMTDAQKNYIYKKGFWDLVKSDAIHTQGIAETVSDFAVHGSPVKATKMAQYILNKMTGQGLVVNGIMNQRTIDLLNSVNQKEFFVRFQALRQEYYFYRCAIADGETVKVNGVNVKVSLPNAAFLSTLTKPKRSQKDFLNTWSRRIANISAQYGAKILEAAKK